MCVICHKPSGVKLDEDVYRECFIYNKDGAGFAYVEKGKIVVEKGYFNFKKLYADIKKVEEAEMVIHFRIATHGVIGTDNCHPFGFEPKRYPNYSFAMAHNGQLPWRSTDKKSDTNCFAEDILFKKWARDPYSCFDDDGIDKILLERFVGTNKLVLMRHNSVKNETDTTIINKSLGVEDLGCWFSNRSYKKVVLNNRQWEQDDHGYGYGGAMPHVHPGSAMRPSSKIIDKYGYRQNMTTGRWEPKNVWEPREMKLQREAEETQAKKEAGETGPPFPKPPEPNPSITVHDFSKKRAATPIQTGIPLLTDGKKDITVPRDEGVVAAAKIFDASEIDLSHLDKDDRNKLKSIAASWAKACGFERKTMNVWQMIRGIRDDFRPAIPCDGPVCDENVDRYLLIELKGDAGDLFDAMKEIAGELKISNN